MSKRLSKKTPEGAFVTWGGREWTVDHESPKGVMLLRGWTRSLADKPYPEWLVLYQGRMQAQGPDREEMLEAWTRKVHELGEYETASNMGRGRKVRMYGPASLRYGTHKAPWGSFPMNLLEAIQYAPGKSDYESWGNLDDYDVFRLSEQAYASASTYPSARLLVRKLMGRKKKVPPTTTGWAWRSLSAADIGEVLNQARRDGDIPPKENPRTCRNPNPAWHLKRARGQRAEAMLAVERANRYRFAGLDTQAERQHDIALDRWARESENELAARGGVTHNPGPAYHRREARRYGKLLKGDLKAGHRGAAGYWQGALSAEAASVAAGGVMQNPLEYTECPACSAKERRRYHATKFPGVYVCGRCGGIYGLATLDEVGQIVKPEWAPKDTPPEQWVYYDFTYPLPKPDKEGRTWGRMHGWFDSVTKKITQTG